MADLEYHPSIDPHDVFNLDVGDGHLLHVEVSGNSRLITATDGFVRIAPWE
jgi:hypothetical protein